MAVRPGSARSIAAAAKNEMDARSTLWPERVGSLQSEDLKQKAERRQRPSGVQRLPWGESGLAHSLPAAGSASAKAGQRAAAGNAGPSERARRLLPKVRLEAQTPVGLVVAPLPAPGDVSVLPQQQGVVCTHRMATRQGMNGGGVCASGVAAAEGGRASRQEKR